MWLMFFFLHKIRACYYIPQRYALGLGPNCKQKYESQLIIIDLFMCCSYCQVSNIRRTLVGNKIVDESDVVGASPVGAAPTTSSLST